MSGNLPKILVYHTAPDTIQVTIPSWGPRSYARALRIVADAVERIADRGLEWPTPVIRRGTIGNHTVIEFSMGVPGHGANMKMMQWFEVIRQCVDRNAMLMAPRHSTGLRTHEVEVVPVRIAEYP